jgi:hypothetical protein
VNQAAAHAAFKLPFLQYWSAEIQYFIERHKHAATYGCCLNVGLESQRAVAWRRSQLAFYHRLLALLEEEKSALQQRCPAMEVPLPTLEAVPEALPVGDNICHTCARYMRVRFRVGFCCDRKWTDSRPGCCLLIEDMCHLHQRAPAQ